MSIARTLIKLREFNIVSAESLPYGHPSATTANVKQALDWIFAVLYPNTKPSVSTVGDLPLVGNDLNDYRVVLDDGDGKAAGYRWEEREGDLAPSWHKIHDMDWSSDAILASFMDKTQDLYVHKNGRMDLDASGNPITGIRSGQTIHGGSDANSNLTLSPNSGDGTGPQSGHVQFDGNARPTSDDTFDLGTAGERFRNIFFNGTLGDGTITLTLQDLDDAFAHSQIITGNPHNTSYDDLTAKVGIITVDGDASGTVDLSTSGDKTLTLTVANDSHTHSAASTITDFDTEVYNYLKAGLVDNDGITWVFDDSLEEVTPTVNIDTSNITDIESDMTFREWRDSEAYWLLRRINFEPNEWIWSYDMTDEEKAAHPEHETVEGYLKVCDTCKAYLEWWEKLTDSEKDIIKAIPNFNADKFEKITGIRIP